MKMRVQWKSVFEDVSAVEVSEDVNLVGICDNNVSFVGICC